MVIIGFMLNYMLRVNLTIAIVAMVVPAVHNTTGNSSKIASHPGCGGSPAVPVVAKIDNATGTSLSVVPVDAFGNFTGNTSLHEKRNSLADDVN